MDIARAFKTAFSGSTPAAVQGVTAGRQDERGPWVAWGPLYRSPRVEAGMRIDRKRGWLLAAVAAATSCVLRIISLLRYLDRLPEDRIGIGLYIAAIVALAIAATGFFIQWRRTGSGD